MPNSAWARWGRWPPLLLSLVTTGCSNHLAVAAPALPHGADLTVGACLDLTGPGAVAAAAAQHGLQVALDRLNHGKFGRCQECGDPISKPRLQALPYARHCIQCARDLESRG